MPQHLRNATPDTDWPTHSLPRDMNLPASMTRLFGRDDAIDDICDLLTRTRLVTLTGPGGIGKTQLALATVRRLTDRFADGVVLVELATVASSDLVLPTIVTALGLWETTSEPVEQRLATFIAARRLLLVIDNAEHLPGAAPDVAALLAACPQLHILVTSRSPLHLRGEHVFDVPPLNVPPDGHLPLSVTAQTDAPPGPATRHLSRTDGLPVSGEYEIVQWVLDFAPGAWSPVHIHGGKVLTTVLEGQITRRADGVETVYKTGESFVEMPDHPHQAGNPTNEPVSLWATAVLPAGAALTTVAGTPSPQPAAESHNALHLPGSGLAADRAVRDRANHPRLRPWGIDTAAYPRRRAAIDDA